MIRALVLLGLGAAVASCAPENPAPAALQEGEVHAPTGLVIGKDWEFVATYCIACHSTKHFLRQRGSASTWQSIIDWMQATQGLQTFPEGVEERIVAYLATHYGPTESWRRAPIPAELMPPNPYSAMRRAAGGK